MVEKKNYKIVVSGKTYSIVSDEPESHITMVSQMINGMMKDIADKMPQATMEQLAVLTALQLSSTVVHQQEQIDLHRSLCASMAEMIASQEL